MQEAHEIQLVADDVPKLKLAIFDGPAIQPTWTPPHSDHSAKVQIMLPSPANQ